MLVLDFAPVRSATASYLKVFWLSVVRAGERWMQAQASVAIEGEPPTVDVYPVLTNLTEDVREEFAVLAKAEGVCAIEARLPRDSELGVVHVHGVLEPSVRETILALSMHGPVSAAALHAAQGSKLAATAWNNRLNELCRLRLATRRKVGRQMVYELIAREVVYG
ncbi:Hypothetical protein I5071_87770 [Sandaracinus amylolyticus]|nr:Hypothetical protein I5071_87770 [Sandaracinus amylolyticus]